MNDPFQLVTNCNFKGKDYLVQMCVLNSKKLEMIITDKIMAEDWQCEYDAPYIEALTHKTGNFKQFDVFVMMLKSGLLKTSDCITLDLLTLEDLEQLRCKKIVNSRSSIRTNQSVRLNRRYLILTYSVEFDRIHYPLPLDYCGPPDPSILQSNIRRLESEIERLKQKNSLQGRGDIGDIKKLKEKIENLSEENKLLKGEIHRLNREATRKTKSVRSNQNLVNCLKKLEEQVLHEKTHNRQIIFKLRAENKELKQQVRKAKEKKKKKKKKESSKSMKVVKEFGKNGNPFINFLQIEDLKKSEKLLNLKLRDSCRYNIERGCRRFLRNSLSPENSLDRKRSAGSKRLDAQLSCCPTSNWNNSTITKAVSRPATLKTIKKSQNRFLSSSSSESEEKRPHKSRSREKRCPLMVDSLLKKSSSCRKSSNERSGHSSADSKKNLQMQVSKFLPSKIGSSREPKSKSLNFASPVKSQIEVRSRESSMSSRSSSKHSKFSQFSQRGSGDCISRKVTPRSGLEEKEEIKFSMSDLEARIHSLQKLLSEGLNF